MKKILALVFLLVFLFSSCGTIATGSSGVSRISRKSTQLKWVLEPTVEADDIQPLVSPLQFESHDNDIINKPDKFLKEALYNQVSCITRGGKRGLISFANDIVLDYIYSKIFIQGTDIYVSQGSAENELQYFLLDEQYNITTEAPPQWFYDTSGCSWVWDTITQRPYYSLNQGPSLSDRLPSRVVPVFEVSINFSAWKSEERITDNGQKVIIYTPLEISEDNPLYFGQSKKEATKTKKGYADEENLLLLPIYDTAQFVFENIGAVRLEDDWYYITMDNEVLNDLGYERVVEAEYHPYVYNFSEGLVAVCRDGLWGYMNKNGEEVIPCQFEATRPVYEGKAWVKTGGLWGVADLSGYVS